jgi:hypothetical protein
MARKEIPPPTHLKGEDDRDENENNEEYMFLK